MHTETLSLSDARALALSSQFPVGQDLHGVIDRLGYIQIDTISVVERAHHHVCWSRLPDYSPNDLQTLHSDKKQIFEYWAHAAAYVPMDDYRYYLPKMESFNNPREPWFRERYARYGHLLGEVLDAIRSNGPMQAKDFESGAHLRGDWWDHKPAKGALELLFWRGELVVSGRKGFQRIFELPERWLPSWVKTTRPGESETARFQVNRALAAFGVATAGEIARYLMLAPGEAINAALKAMVHEGIVETVKIHGLAGIPMFCAPQALKGPFTPPQAEKEVHILSPFDNLLIQRRRTAWLFGFNYRLECYIPQKKREFGYFALPLLHDDRFAGILDAKADRKAGRLIMKNLFLSEASLAQDLHFQHELAAAVSRFARFNRCTAITIEQCNHPHLTPLFDTPAL
ncbi:winged helix DNA-binding domain-containing protein [Myxococcota bacterium]|nr:winged helix DNA-binding domain-containing protein [Myxococcota bacterium]MBU1535435.1 winged helix DNA-binding domain-containing protein [Myxococcota bacterium]